MSTMQAPSGGVLRPRWPWARCDVVRATERAAARLVPKPSLKDSNALVARRKRQIHRLSPRPRPSRAILALHRNPVLVVEPPVADVTNAVQGMLQVLPQPLHLGGEPPPCPLRDLWLVVGEVKNNAGLPRPSGHEVQPRSQGKAPVEGHESVDRGRCVEAPDTERLLLAFRVWAMPQDEAVGLDISVEREEVHGDGVARRLRGHALAFEALVEEGSVARIEAVLYQGLVAQRLQLEGPVGIRHLRVGGRLSCRAFDPSCFRGVEPDPQKPSSHASGEGRRTRPAHTEGAAGRLRIRHWKLDATTVLVETPSVIPAHQAAIAADFPSGQRREPMRTCVLKARP
mmetsp:Transcript_15365/g.42120  ORF Transcript_15365/g.42120 Transcript_15365/m.42120 type:complete len:342 (+) Transcript_15365:321-1346(+)